MTKLAPAKLHSESLPHTLADEAREADQPILRYTKDVRAGLIQMMQDRAHQVVKDPEAHRQSDPFQIQLRALLRRFEDVENIVRAFSVQTIPGCSPGEDQANAAMEQMTDAVEALFAIELEARAAQARLAASAVVQEYAGVKRLRPQTLKFNVDYHLADRFKRLQTRLKQERMRLLGRAETVDSTVLLNLLVSLGEANVQSLVLLGCPDVSVTFAVAQMAELVRERAVKEA